MITNATEMLAALKRKEFAGIVLYDGPSQIDGAPIVAIANRITEASNNEKTGAMIQTWIIRSDMSPTVALKTGDDSSVCGDCKHRPANSGACYVKVFQAPRSVYVAYRKGRYAVPGVDYDPAIIPGVFAGKKFRLGSYGDPAAVPFQIWRACTLLVEMKAGYSHQWMDKRFAAFKLLCMASADSVAEMEKAHAMGWRTFRVRGSDESKVDGKEAVCPASKEAGYKTNCASCKACGGTSAKARVSMVIMAHGSTAKRFTVAA